MLREVDGRPRVYRRTGERYLDACVERCDAYAGGSVMIWAGITARHKSDVVFVDGRLTGVRYHGEILNRHVVPVIQHHGGVFQQDNARPTSLACLLTSYNVRISMFSLGRHLCRHVAHICGTC